MANRYGRDIGRRDREGFGNEERDRSHYPRSGSGFGSTPFGEDESYFGGSRRYGEGYTGDSPRDFDTGGGDFGRSSAGYSDRGSWLGGYEDDRYSQGNERSQGWSGSSRRDYSRGPRDEDRYSARFSGGGSSGRYETGGGYSGFSERGGSTRGLSGSGGYGNYRSGSGYSGYSGGGGRQEDRYSNRGWSSDYGSDYPSSDRGYLRGGYDEGGDERGWMDKTADEVSSWFGDEEAARRRRMDQRGGGHRGRGPSGYTRSDERIKEDINDRLTDYDYIDATGINVEVQNGDVILSGTVESRYEKRLAEDIAEDCSGVKNVENRLRVSNQNRSSTYGQGTSSYSSDTESTSGTTEAPGSINRTTSETTTGSTSTTASGSTSGQKARGKSSSG